jgi:hypothetical protein
MTNTDYNGWTNRETWLVNLWIDNEPALSECVANDAVNYPELYDLSAQIKDNVEAFIFGDDAPACLATDLIYTALADVNWREIAQHKSTEFKGA